MRTIAGLLVFGLMLVGCSDDPTAAEGYQELEQKLATAESQLTEVTAQRDSLAAQIAVDQSRYQKTKGGQDVVTQIIADPTSFGTEEEVLDLVMEHFTEEAVMDDDVYGPVPARAAWRNTLYGDLDADIHTWHRWLTEDGSNGGSLWTWSGTNFVGQPFELIGISLLEYDDDGKQTYQLVVYPYDDDQVHAALGG